MGHATDADELLEVFSDELGTIVRDDPRGDLGKAFPGPLDDGLHIGFRHGFPNFPVDDEATIAVEQTVEVVERAGDVEIGNIHMPVFMGSERLLEPFAFAGGFAVMGIHEASLLEYPVDAGGADGDDITVEHHEGQPAIAFQGMVLGEVNDGLFLGVGQPPVPWNPTVVLIDFAEALPPVVELAFTDAEPGHELFGRDLGPFGPAADVLDDGIAGIMGNPKSV